MLIIAVMLTLQITQWLTLHGLRQQKQLIEQRLTPFNQLSCEQKKLEDELPSLEKTVTTIEHAQPDQDLFLSLFNAIQALLGPTGSVESLALNGKKIELTIGLASVKTAQEFMDKLAQLPAVNSVELGSIHKGATQLLFAINGTLAS